MTKTIVLPISKETCETIGVLLLAIVWIGGTATSWYFFTDVMILKWNWEGLGNIVFGAFIGGIWVVFTGLSTIGLLYIAHASGIWFNVKCNCDLDKKKDESSESEKKECEHDWRNNPMIDSEEYCSRCLVSREKKYNW